MASTSSAMNGGRYDVFLSFRGADTRTNFTSHLYTALSKEGVNAFMDKNLRRGDEISSTLFQVIEASQISIVVFSPNYAVSKFCLEELVKIMECKASRGQIVFPVFYNVDPFEVEKQTGHYGTALYGHEFEFMGKLEKVQRWRTVLAEVADLSSWDLRNRDESEVIGEIVQDVLEKLNLKKSAFAAELKERRLNEEKERIQRKLASIENMTSDLNKVITDSFHRRKQNNDIGTVISTVEMVDDRMLDFYKVYDRYNGELRRWNEKLLKDYQSPRSSTSTNDRLYFVHV